MKNRIDRFWKDESGSALDDLFLLLVLFLTAIAVAAIMGVALAVGVGVIAFSVKLLCKLWKEEKKGWFWTVLALDMLIVIAAIAFTGSKIAESNRQQAISVQATREYRQQRDEMNEKLHATEQAREVQIQAQREATEEAERRIEETERKTEEAYNSKEKELLEKIIQVSSKVPLHGHLSYTTSPYHPRIAINHLITFEYSDELQQLLDEYQDLTGNRCPIVTFCVRPCKEWIIEGKPFEAKCHDWDTHYEYDEGSCCGPGPGDPLAYENLTTWLTAYHEECIPFKEICVYLEYCGVKKKDWLYNQYGLTFPEESSTRKKICVSLGQ